MLLFRSGSSISDISQELKYPKSTILTIINEYAHGSITLDDLGITNIKTPNEITKKPKILSKKASNNKGKVKKNTKNESKLSMKNNTQKNEIQIETNSTKEYKRPGLKQIFNNAVSYQRKKDYESAKKQYSQVIELYPNYKYTYYHLALIYQQERKYNESISLFKKFIFYDNTKGEAWFHLAISYYKVGNKDDFKRSYSEAITLDPSLAFPQNHYDNQSLNLFRTSDDLYSLQDYLNEKYEKEVICSICFKESWEIIIENGYEKQICTKCGYEKELRPTQIYYNLNNAPSVSGDDHWDGVIDNIENILEKHI